MTTGRETKIKVFKTVMLILKDLLKLSMQCLVFTILFSVCFENGWIFQNQVEISHEDFTHLYLTCCIVVPFIVFYRLFTGKYWIEVIHHEFSSFDRPVAKKASKFKILKGGK